MNNKITVVLNGFGRPQHFDRQLESVLNQTVKPSSGSSSTILLTRSSFKLWGGSTPDFQPQIPTNFFQWNGSGNGIYIDRNTIEVKAGKVYQVSFVFNEAETAGGHTLDYNVVLTLPTQDKPGVSHGEIYSLGTFVMDDLTTPASPQSITMYKPGVSQNIIFNVKYQNDGLMQFMFSFVGGVTTADWIRISKCTIKKLR